MTKLTVGSFGTQLTLEVLAGLSFGLAFLLPPARPADRAAALPPVRCRGRHRPLGQFRADHPWGRGRICSHRRRLKQLVYNYYGNTSSEGPIIFAAALSTVLVNPIQEWITALVRKPLPEEPRDPPRRASRHRSRPARDGQARRADRRDPRPHHQGRPHDAYRRDHRPGRVPRARHCPRRRSRSGRSRPSDGRIATKRSATRATSSSRSAFPWSPAKARRRSATCSSDRGRMDR